MKKSVTLLCALFLCTSLSWSLSWDYGIRSDFQYCDIAKQDNGHWDIRFSGTNGNVAVFKNVDLGNNKIFGEHTINKYSSNNDYDETTYIIDDQTPGYVNSSFIYNNGCYNPNGQINFTYQEKEQNGFPVYNIEISVHAYYELHFSKVDYTYGINKNVPVRAYESDWTTPITLQNVDEPTSLVLNDNENNASKLSANLNKEQDIQLMRTFQAGMWNTVCLPFALNADQIAAAFGAGTKVGSMTRGETVGDELFLNFDTKETTMVAGQPYIIFPGDDENVVNPTFESVTITTTDAGSYQSPTSEVVFTGVFSPTSALEASDYYLGVNNTIHSVALGTLKGFRAYFDWWGDPNHDWGAPKRVHMLINGTETTTAMDEMEVLNPAEKMIENGQVVIIKNGVKYNVFGQQL